jgi:hypothetical protein
VFFYLQSANPSAPPGRRAGCFSPWAQGVLPGELRSRGRSIQAGYATITGARSRWLPDLDASSTSRREDRVFFHRGHKGVCLVCFRPWTLDAGWYATLTGAWSMGLPDGRLFGTSSSRTGGVYNLDAAVCLTMGLPAGNQRCRMVFEVFSEDPFDCIGGGVQTAGLCQNLLKPACFISIVRIGGYSSDQL